MASVQFSPFTSIWENKPCGVLIVGAPGSGKSFFIINLAANAKIMEQRIFAIDPKNDLGVLKNMFPDIQLIDINDIQPGMLDPFNVIENIDTNTIASIISIICGGLSDEQITAITPIINDFVNKYKRTNSKVCFADIVDYLYANDNQYAQNIGTKLQIHRDSKYGKLIFEESNEIMKLDKFSKIISIHGMDLPKPKLGEGINTITEEQKFNSAIVYIICRMLKDVLTKGNYPTLLIIDEAHIAYQNPAFASIINEFLILGRSLNVATVLASQSVSHYPKDIPQLIANKFCFKSSTNEASEFLSMFFNRSQDNMTDFDSIVNEISDFNKGRQQGDPKQVFMIDSENRSGIFDVVSMFGNDITSNPLLKR